jgi:NAD-dependent DNA ligase/DNA polymerase/3'-5' exonuclease PolX
MYMDPKKRLNESLVTILGKLAEMKTDNPFKNRAYTTAQETIMDIQEDITDIEQLRGRPGIGSTIMEKLTEFVKTGKIAKLEQYRANPVSIFSEIYGVGPKKAAELVAQGMTTIAQLRKNPQLLNATQKMGLQYYEDILERIPRQEIDEYNGVFHKVADGISGVQYEIVGSYRRMAASSGDIDVIITAPDASTFDQFLDTLIKMGVIEVVLSRGKSKCLVIASLPSHRGRRGGFVYRRVDFLFTTRTEYPFSILYFTGSKGFNVVMRNRALSLGYSMNEHGLTVKGTGAPISQTFSNEQDIFAFLGMEYKRPEERVDGRSVVLKAAVQQLPPSVALPKVVAALPKAAALLKVLESPKVEVISSSFQQKIDQTRNDKFRKFDVLVEGNSSSFQQKIDAPEQKQDKPKSPKTKKIRHTMKPRASKKNVLSSVSAQPSNKALPEDLLKLFVESGISVLDGLSESQLSSMIVKANDMYYNSVQGSSNTEGVSDAQYDIIKEYIERKFPANVAIKQVGAPVVKNKVVLPYEMPSMDKIKPESGALAAWTAKYKGPYILSAKLDGVSGLYTCEGDAPKLYTRGDGKVGQDVSHLTRVLSLPCVPDLVVRGEFILRKSVFETKYKGTFATARNLVAGIVNAKTIDDKTRDLDFVVYEVIKPVVKPSKQMETLLAHGFNTVWNTSTKSLSNDTLSTILQDTRSKYEYETDGIIVTNDAVYPRGKGNPEHAFAFKMAISDQMAEAKVVDVLWEVSQDGYFKPRIRIEPVNIAGVNIEYTTGFNGKFIEENGIGVGAVVRIIRSGDVIPYVREVIAPAEKAKMPDVPYVWTTTRVDIMVENAAEDPGVKRKNVVGFFLELDIKGLGESNLKKIVDAGHDTVAKILGLQLADLEKVFGKGKTGPALYEGIRNRIADASLAELMTASNMFGRGIGRKSVDALLKDRPDFLTSTENKTWKLEALAKVGVKKNGEQFYDAIVPFRRFLEECGLAYKLAPAKSEEPVSTVDTKNPLYNKSIVMTKVRDAAIIDFLKHVGATLDDTMKTTTFVLIVKDKGDVSSKTKYAEARGIPIMTVEEFKTLYF